MGAVSDGFLNSCISYLKTELCKPKKFAWDSERSCLPLQDYCYNLYENKLVNHSEQLFNRLLLPYKIEDAHNQHKNMEPDPTWVSLLESYKKYCPLIYNFIETCFPADEQEQYLSYPIKNKNDVQTCAEMAWLLLQSQAMRIRDLECFFVLYGGPNTGKSTLIDLLRRMVGDQATLYLTFNDLNSPFGLAPLVKREIQVMAITEGCQLSRRQQDQIATKIKSITSAVDRLSVNQKYLNSAEVRFRGILVMATNELIFDTNTTRGVLDKRLIPLIMENRISLSCATNYAEEIPDKEFAHFVSIIGRYYKGQKGHENLKQKILELRQSELVKSLNQNMLMSAEDNSYVAFIMENLKQQKGGLVPIKPRLPIHFDVPYLSEEYQKFVLLNLQQFNLVNQNQERFNEKAFMKALNNFFGWFTVKKTRRRLKAKEGTKHKIFVFTDLAYKNFNESP